MRENQVIIACAGSGKTTRLVQQALAAPDRRIAIVTYTNSNAREITERFAQMNSGTPSHVDVMTWYGFLLRECARPYQRAKYARERIESILFVNEKSAPYIKEVDTGRYYFANRNLIYSDKISRFVMECERQSGKAVTGRLERSYTDIFIDEFQDLAGWDLEVVAMLLQSGVRLTLVGDPRQHIYSTNPSQKNRQYLGIKVVGLMKSWARKGWCSHTHMNTTHRCDGSICEFSNALWPGMEPMQPARNVATEHNGVFLVAEADVPKYLQRFKPHVLRNRRDAKSYGAEAVNFGQAKGLQFDRVLIVPTGPIGKYLQTGDLGHLAKARDKLHVAVTRARHSVAFILDGESTVVTERWSP